MRQTLACFFVLLACIGVGQAQSSNSIYLEVSAGGHDRIHCPVVFALPESMRAAKRFRLLRDPEQTPVAVQKTGRRDAPRITWMIHDRLPGGEKRRYQLQWFDTGRRPATEKVVQCQDDGRQLHVSVGGQPVLTFNHATVPSPAGIDPVYGRSGYLHPVLTPAGQVVTGDFATDHPHQHGVFFAWVNTTFAGDHVDFWNQAKGSGKVEVTSVGRRIVSGPVFAQFTAQLAHNSLAHEEEVPVLQETWMVRVYHARDPFLFEITSRQQTASDKPLTINEYHYGGLAVRGRADWLLSRSSESVTDDGDAVAGFVTSSGRRRADGNHTRARWVEMHGPAGESHAGIIVMGAQSNFRSPQTVRLHPTKPYFCFAPMVLGEFQIRPGETFSSRFRFAVHDGPQDEQLAERLWQDFAHPPKVTVVK